MFDFILEMPKKFPVECTTFSFLLPLAATTPLKLLEASRIRLTHHAELLAEVLELGAIEMVVFKLLLENSLDFCFDVFDQLDHVVFQRRRQIDEASEDRHQARHCLVSFNDVHAVGVVCEVGDALFDLFQV